MKNDEVLLFGGGFSYDTKDKKFLTSKPHLLLYNATSKVVYKNIRQHSKSILSIACRKKDRFFQNAPLIFIL